MEEKQVNEAEIVDLTGEEESECYSQDLFSATAGSAESKISPWQRMLHSSIGY